MGAIPVMDYLASLGDKRKHAWERAKAIMDTAATEGRDLSAEERANLEQTDVAIDGYAAEEKRILDTSKKMVAADALLANIEPALRESREDRFSPVITERRAFTDVMGSFSKGEPVRRAFDSHRTIPVGYEMRYLGQSGGTAIATTFADFVTVYERTMNPMMDVARVIQTTSGNPIVLPRLTADVTAGGSTTAEAAAITEGDPTISSVTLNAYKKAHITLWSAELDEDEVIGLRQLMADAISRPISLGWGTDFTTGAGSVTANGFITAATNGGTAAGTAGNQASDTFFAATDLIDLYYSLAAPYRQNASWMVSSTALGRMHKFRSSTGEFLWAPGVIGGAPDTFLNRPIYENPAMAAVASASKSVAVGDFSKYIIRDVVPMRVDISSEYKYNTDQLAIRVITRRDGDLPDVAAIAYLVSANT